MRIVVFLIWLLHCLPARAQLAEVIQRHVKEVDSNRLQFLDTVLKDKRIVLLGESSHGTEEYSQLKFQLIRYLHEKLGYKVLLFESPMTNASYVNSASDTQVVTHSIQSLWHTETVAKLFNYVKSSGMQFGGFDPQFVQSPYPALLYTQAFSEYPAIQEPLLQLESRVGASIAQPGLYLSLKDSFSTAYAGIAHQLSQITLSPWQQWMQQIVRTNVGYYKRITNGDQRDSCMAKNIIWLAENLYANEKIIIWAHNTHIDKNASNKRIMGKLLAAHFNKDLYAIGLYMTNGTTALNNRKVITVEPPPKGSLEEGLSGFTTAFIETSYPAFDRRIPTLHAGKDKQLLNLSKSFDAVILINGVHAPVYLH